MAAQTLGRTNQVFPAVWYRPVLPADPADLPELLEALGATSNPIDISTSPGLWGGNLPIGERVVSVSSSADYELAADAEHAGNLIEAHLIETMSCIGRPYLDFYFLRVRRPSPAKTVEGALQALELARQEGHIRHVGLSFENAPDAALHLWEDHDAFDVLLLAENRSEGPTANALQSFMGSTQFLAVQRRVGIVTVSDHPEKPGVTMLKVSSATAVRRAQRSEVAA